MAKKILESLRDRVVHRSQIGKLKLDRAATRRALDKALRDLGEHYNALVKRGLAEARAELAREMEEVERIEKRLAETDKEIEELESEHLGKKQGGT